MRTAPLRTALFGLLLASGCTVGDVGPNGGGGDDVVGDGDGSDGGDDAVVVDAPTPKLAVSVDKPTWMSELGAETMVTLSLTGSDGFSGAVNLVATVVDTAGAPLAGWTVELADPIVTLAENGVGTTVATVKIPTLNAGLAATLKFDVTNSLVSAQTIETVGTVLNQVSIPITRGGGGNGCQYPADFTQTRVKVGTTVRFVNADDADSMRIHTSGGDGVGIPHQDNDMGPGTAYARLTTDAGSVSWYCHTPGNNPGNLVVEIVE